MNNHNQLQIRNSTIENSVCWKFRHTANDDKNYQGKNLTKNN